MKAIIWFLILFPFKIFAQDGPKEHQPKYKPIDDSTWQVMKKNYSYTKSWFKYLKVRDYVIVYNGLLISDSLQINCVIDKLDFHDRELDRYYGPEEAIKKFGINRLVWYIRSKKFTVVDFEPIIKCLCIQGQ